MNVSIFSGEIRPQDKGLTIPCKHPPPRKAKKKTIKKLKFVTEIFYFTHIAI
jgi:hypothetical protein